MSESGTIRARRLPDGTLVRVLEDGSTQPFERRTDWTAFDAMTEDELEANARSDPDNPPMTTEELARMQPVPNAKEIRQRMNLSQEQFAVRFHVPIGTLRDWEQGRTAPDTTARAFLRVIEVNPEAVEKALGR
jgi:putative transcriptional regulator